MDTKLAKNWAELDARYAELKSQMQAVKAERDKRESQLLEMMAEDGINKITVSVEDENGGHSRTVYPHRQIWAGHQGDKDALCDALKKAGLDEYVKPNFNSNQLSAYIREYDPNNVLEEEDIRKRLPLEIQPYIKVTEKIQLRSRKA